MLQEIINILPALGLVCAFSCYVGLCMEIGRTINPGLGIFCFFMPPLLLVMLLFNIWYSPRMQLIFIGFIISLCLAAGFSMMLVPN
jgi:hypothetical protein